MTCPHGMPTEASCTDCMYEGGVVPPKVWAKVGDPFPARFDGDCGGCGFNMWPPDLIQRWDLGDTEQTVYTHPDCRPTR